MIGAILFHGLCEMYVRMDQTEDVISSIEMVSQLVSAVIYTLLIMHFWDGWISRLIAGVWLVESLVLGMLPLPKSCAAYKLRHIQWSKVWDGVVVPAMSKQRTQMDAQPSSHGDPASLATSDDANAPALEELAGQPAPGSLTPATSDDASAPALEELAGQPAPTPTASTEQPLDLAGDV